MTRDTCSDPRWDSIAPRTPGVPLVVTQGLSLFGLQPALETLEALEAFDEPRIRLGLRAGAPLDLGHEHRDDDRRDGRDEGDAEEHERAGDHAAAAGHGDRIAVADRRDGLHCPPAGLAEGLERLGLDEA